jgi:hypothetical protein
MRRAALFFLPLTLVAQTVDSAFDQDVKPFVTTYCLGCHSGAKPAAQFDLSPYKDSASVRRDLGHWTHVLDRLTAGTMPPKGMKQPEPAVRDRVIAWIQSTRREEALKQAGDPGPVLARRLSNAEYNYTIRDLTGVDLQPAKEFPVDPANTFGFDNTGESLTMSPALLGKYLQAARKVADHAALTPTGITFAPHPMLVETDREKYAIQRIVNFYLSQPTDYAEYFQAAWRFKHRALLGKPNATLLDFAKEAKLSAKYIPLIWEILGETGDGSFVEAGPIAKLRAMWRALPPPNTFAPETERALFTGMRDFVVRIRKHTAMEFRAPKVAGLSPTSQPLMNWKLRQFNANRRKFDVKALRMDTDPPLEVPEPGSYPGLGREAADRAEILMLKNRAGDRDLIVPTGQREQWIAAFERFADVFPDAFYIKERGRFFPDDSEDKGRLLSAGYHNVMGYWRDDQPLIELILDEKQKAELDHLWLEFEYLGDYTARTWVQYFFNQSGEVQGKGRESGTERPSDKAVSEPAMIFELRDRYIEKAKAYPDNDPVAITAIETHFAWLNDTLRNIERVRTESEPKHLEALMDFASRAYRRPLANMERDEVLTFYRSLRDKSGLTHEEAIRDSIVRVLMSPNFCFRADLVSEATPAKAPGKKAKKQVRKPVDAAAKTTAEPLSDFALASRLSYFLWSSGPDKALLELAAKGELRKPEVLLAETRRMLYDPRARALATEFAGNWLDFRRFEQHNSVDRERFPRFTNELRQAMFEEPIRFLDDAIRSDRSMLDLLYAKHTFVNPVLARHYKIPDVEGDNDRWVMVKNASTYGRGGLLPMAVFLTQSSPGLRTSPVKRGYWVVRRVLGETIPPPPPNVPELPEDESKADRPLRELLARHRDNAACASCHARFDSFGLAFENYGPVGERRERDLADRRVDTRAEFPGPNQTLVAGTGLEGVQKFISEYREQDFVSNVSRMMLAYALGRSLLLSDEPLLEEIRTKLAAREYRFFALVEGIVSSPQFRNRRLAGRPPSASATD